jgi:hypothetical protein
MNTEDKSLLPSLCQREELPLFGKVDKTRPREGRGEIFRRVCLLNYGLLSKYRSGQILEFLLEYLVRIY